MEVQFHGEVSLASTVLTTVFRIYSDDNTLLQFYKLLILHAIQENFFIDGLRDFRYLDEHYQAIGVVMGNTVYK